VSSFVSSNNSRGGGGPHQLGDLVDEASQAVRGFVRGCVHLAQLLLMLYRILKPGGADEPPKN
jgi:hypothetical protein